MPHPQAQQHPVAHISPVMGRNAPIGPSPSVSAAPSLNGLGVAASRSNGASLVAPTPVSPIGPPPGSSAASIATSPRPINIGPIGGIIGRPVSSVSSQRSTSPPPRVFGSSALAEDDEIVVPPPRQSSQATSMPTQHQPGPPSQPQIGQQQQQQQSQQAQSQQAHSQSASSSSDWSSPFSGGIWGAPAIAAPVVTPDRNSVIRDRARVSYLKLDELSHGTNAPIPIGDIHRALITLWPDSVSVE